MKRSYDPTQGIEQFIIGVYAYWQDKGVSKKSSQKRMISSTYEALKNILSKQENKDVLLVEHAKQFQYIVKSQGESITQEAIRSGRPTPKQSAQLKRLRELDRSMALFITEYSKGSESNGESSN